VALPVLGIPRTAGPSGAGGHFRAESETVSERTARWKSPRAVQSGTRVKETPPCVYDPWLPSSHVLCSALPPWDDPRARRPKPYRVYEQLHDPPGTPKSAESSSRYSSRQHSLAMARTVKQTLVANGVVKNYEGDDTRGLGMYYLGTQEGRGPSPPTSHLRPRVRTGTDVPESRLESVFPPRRERPTLYRNDNGYLHSPRSGSKPSVPGDQHRLGVRPRG
jgi:hypothetical protein